MSQREPRPAQCRVDVFGSGSGPDASLGDGDGPVEVSDDESPERCVAVRGRVGMSVGRLEAERARRPISVLVAIPKSGVRSRPRDERVGGVDVLCGHGPRPGGAAGCPTRSRTRRLPSRWRGLIHRPCASFRDREVVLEMAVAEATGVAFETLFAVLAQRLEQPIPHR